ncbi:CoA transferase [Nocardioides montaniterrae]
MTGSVERWWGGPLDAESLALTAVEAAAASVRLLGTYAVTVRPRAVAGSFAAAEHLVVDGRPAAGWAPLSGFVQAADGWVRLHANYPHHAAALRAALGVSDRAALDQVAGSWTAAEIEASVLAAGGIATVVRTSAEWQRHPHHLATRALPWLSTEEGGERTPVRSRPSPLAGVRVLDLTRVIAGPTCSQLLACLGADVLRIDPPARPELLDQFLSNGMGKRSVELDLGTHLDVVRRDLLPRADVVLLGYRPGSLTRFGLDPVTLWADHPSLVVGSLSAWGETGPWGSRPGFDSIVQAATGIADLHRTDDGRPGALAVQALDHATGYRLAAAVIDLLARGSAGTVRASLLGAARTLLDLPRPAAGVATALAVETVRVASAYGPLDAVAPPLEVDGHSLAAPVERYGSTEPRWR